MIISRTPFRISFAGGGSDLPSFYRRETGAVLSTSIDKYMYIAIHPFFEREKIQLKYSKTEQVDRIEDIKQQIQAAIVRYREIKQHILLDDDSDDSHLPTWFNALNAFHRSL